jgi:hypothetical protein
VRSPISTRAVLASALLLAAAGSHAASFSFQGMFGQDKDIAFFKFVTDGSGDITLRTYGYAGGVLSDGTPVDAGGFDPLLTLYDDTGLMVYQSPDCLYACLNDDGASVDTDPITGNAFDSLFVGTLGAGTYWLALTESNNYGDPHLYNNFGWDGWTGNQTSTNFGCSPSTGNPFYEWDCATRNGQWALDIWDVTSAESVSRDVVTSQFQPPPPPSPPPLPEPSTFTLLGLGLAGLLRRKNPPV